MMTGRLPGGGPLVAVAGGAPAGAGAVPVVGFAAGAAPLVGFAAAVGFAPGAAVLAGFGAAVAPEAGVVRGATGVGIDPAGATAPRTIQPVTPDPGSRTWRQTVPST